MPDPGDERTPRPGSTTGGAQRVSDQSDGVRGDATARSQPLPDGTVAPQEAADWLTYPLLSFSTRVVASDGREFAEYASRSASPNPRDGALVHVIWQPKALPYSLDEETDRGGLHSMVRVFLTADLSEGAQREPSGPFRDMYREVTVRGHDALMSEGYTDESEIEKRGDEPWRRGSNVDFRSIEWTTDLDAEHWAHWVVTSDPLQYAEAESISIVDAMDVLSPG